MTLPFWMLPRPVIAEDPALGREFDRLLSTALADGGAVQGLDYRLSAPKWQFLCYLGDRGRVVLHGSNDGTIEEFEPRQADDVSAFGAQRAVYASSDGIWPIFFAVVDRGRYGSALVNGSVRIGEPAEHGYFFSLDREELAAGPWRAGWVYLLPTTTFVTETLDERDGQPVISSQCASAEPVRPYARLAVAPSDFPFLDRVHGHDSRQLAERVAADPTDFPWVRAGELHR